MLTIVTISAALAFARDAQFAEAQVEFVVATRTVRDLEQVMPARQARLIRLLGSPDGLVRQLAEAELVAVADAESLVWGMHARDPEVAQSCLRIRDVLLACGRCRGTGKCPECEGQHPDYRCPARCDWDYNCGACGGSGDPRSWLRWRDGRPVVTPRDLFAADGSGPPPLESP